MPTRIETEQQTVLVVDDDEDLLVVLREVIEEERYRVLIARDGEEALRILDSGETPCLIVLDMRMPGMSGQEFRRRQLADSRIAKIPVIGFTGLADADKEASLLALSSYLHKPVHLHQLLEAVAHFCSDPDHIDSTSRPASAAR